MAATGLADSVVGTDLLGPGVSKKEDKQLRLSALPQAGCTGPPSLSLTRHFLSGNKLPQVSWHKTAAVTQRHHLPQFRGGGGLAQLGGSHSGSQLDSGCDPRHLAAKLQTATFPGPTRLGSLKAQTAFHSFSSLCPPCPTNSSCLVQNKPGTRIG